MTLVRLIKMCLNETYSKVCICKKTCLMNFLLRSERRCFITTAFPENKETLKLNGKHQCLLYADKNKNTIKKHTKAVLNNQ
jgi:hypothetical protein